MISVSLQAFIRPCAPVSGGISDLVVFDPSDYDFTQPVPILGVAQKYGAIALRPAATGVGATAATATLTILAVGADGDEINVYAPALLGSALLGSFVKTASETTVTLLAVAVKNAINAGTLTHGYSATNVAGVITITAPAAVGAVINTYELVVDEEGTIDTSDTAFSGGVTGTGGKMYVMNFLRDEAEWAWKQSVKGCSVKYEHSFTFQLPENSHTLTTFMAALDAAACCGGLGMIFRLNDGKIFVCGEKYVNGSSIQKFTILNNGSSGTSGKLYDDFNGGTMVLTGPYSRSLYEYSGDWADVEALQA